MSERVSDTTLEVITAGDAFLDSYTRDTTGSLKDNVRCLSGSVTFVDLGEKNGGFVLKKQNWCAGDMQQKQMREKSVCVLDLSAAAYEQRRFGQNSVVITAKACVLKLFVLIAVFLLEKVRNMDYNNR